MKAYKKKLTREGGKAVRNKNNPCFTAVLFMLTWQSVILREGILHPGKQALAGENLSAFKVPMDNMAWSASSRVGMAGLYHLVFRE